ncbi:MAG: hypothetical protein AAGK14_03440 [Verrucomicrobiota bacterium]
MTRRFLPAVGVTACLLGLAGCGGGSDEASENPMTELSQEAAKVQAEISDGIRDDIENARAAAEPSDKPESLLDLADDLMKTVEAEAGAAEKDHVLALRIFYTSAAQAHQAAQALQGQGFVCEVLAPDPETGRTAILAKYQLKPSRATLESALNVAIAQIEALEGVYDSYAFSQGTIDDTKN